MRVRHQDLHRCAVVLGRQQGPAPLRQAADDPGTRVPRPRGRGRREPRRRGLEDRRPHHLRADRSLRRVPLLQAWRVLDVRGARPLRFPEERERRVREIHAVPEDRPQPPRARRPAARARGADRTLRMLGARGEPRPDPARRRRRAGRCRPARSRHGGCRPAQEPVEAGGARHQARSSGARQDLRRRHRDEPARDRRRLRGSRR